MTSHDAVDRVSLARIAAAIATGVVVWWLVLGAGIALLRLGFPGYVEVEPEKAYSLGMLFARLLVFSSTIVAVALVAAWVAADVRLAWVAGALILALSIPDHLVPGFVWDDYPVWYHLVYLASILPLALTGGAIWRRAFGAPTEPARQASAPS